MQKKLKMTTAEADKILKAIGKRHKIHMRPGEGVTLEGAMTHGVAEVELVLSDADETEVLTVQGKIDLEENEIQSPLEARDMVMDFVDEALQEYFASGRSWRPPLDWSQYDYRDNSIWLRGELRNLKLDRMADELLAR